MIVTSSAETPLDMGSHHSHEMNSVDDANNTPTILFHTTYSKPGETVTSVRKSRLWKDDEKKSSTGSKQVAFGVGAKLILLISSLLKFALGY
jgi:hypothetical protein